ncbi:TonB-dependent receptor [Ramlibacter sp. PS4R-6]|uniref:TonB-dependent receptor n=1 Tax=Ramlibacter sp. PS4R-6 TaxID=3133438 RepID=UPI003095176E
MKRAMFRRHAIAAASLAALAPMAPAQEATAQLERIVITSERRMTLLDTTPASVTALPGGKLQESGYTGIEDVVNLVPNATLTGQTGNNAQLYVRGIGNVFILAGGDPGVALYSDGAYVSDQTSSNVSLFDLQRVEVLRGPQGALYGRNATGGAMNLISALPTDSFRASANVVLGNYGRKESEGFVSGPVAGEGSTSMRVSYQIKKLDGWTSNPLAGTVSGPVVSGSSTTAPKKLDEVDSQALRIQSLTNFASGSKLRLMAGYYHEDDTGQSVPLLVDPVMIPGLLYGVSPSTNPRIQKSQGSEKRIEVGQLLANWSMPVGDNTLDVTASYRKSRADHLFDSDGTEALVASTGFKTRSTDKSLDVHLTSADGVPLQWLVGATLLRFDQTQDVDVSSQVPLGFLMPGGPFNVGVPLQFLLGGKVETSSAAVYTDLRYQVTPKVALLGGLRLNRDHKVADEFQNIAVFGIAGTNHLDASWTSVPASLGVEYKISDGSIAYARVSHGFKSGAVNLGSLQPSMVKPETVIAGEVGYKVDFADRRGLFSAAAFTSRYKDMQVSQVGIANVILANASKARIDGAELELSYKPIPPLTVNAAVGIMDPRYTDFTNVDLRNAPTTVVNVRGNQLANVPKSNAAIGVEYALPISGWRATVRADYVYRGKVYFTEFNTPDAVQEAFSMVNLAFSVKPVQGNWKLFGWVKNATNKTAITSMSVASPVLGAARQVTYTPPRMFGIGAQVDF